MKSRIYILFLLVVGFTINHAHACGNAYYSPDPPVYGNKLTLEYLLRQSESMSPYWQHGFQPIAYEIELSNILQKLKRSGWKPKNPAEITWTELERALNDHADYKALSDLAWYELRLGNRANAIRLLERLYKMYPDEYNILANLGTGYELTGRNKEALMLLKKAVAINPASHFGSEWIHIRILEQKIAATPAYSKVLDLPADSAPSEWKTGKDYRHSISPDSLMVQLAYQLHERISFTAPPDPVVEQLVHDFASLVEMTHSKAEAAEFYQFALEYKQGAKPDVADTVKSAAAGKTEAQVTDQKKNNSGIYFYAVIGLLVLAGLLLAITKRQKKNSRDLAEN